VWFDCHTYIHTVHSVHPYMIGVKSSQFNSYENFLLQPQMHENEMNRQRKHQQRDPIHIHVSDRITSSQMPHPRITQVDQLDPSRLIQDPLLLHPLLPANLLSRLRLRGTVLGVSAGGFRHDPWFRSSFVGLGDWTVAYSSSLLQVGVCE
jgi:hypothetical protein